MSNDRSNYRKNQGYKPGVILADLCRIRSAEPKSLGFAREIRANREAQSLAAWFDGRGHLAIRDAPRKIDALTGGELRLDPLGVPVKRHPEGKMAAVWKIDRSGGRVRLGGDEETGDVGHSW